MSCFAHEEFERAATIAALSHIGIVCEDVVIDKLLDHLKLVNEKNKVLNLTRIDSVEEGIVLHIADSLSVLPEFNETAGRFLDIGTGAGFPGIPLAVFTNRSGTLLDSVKKKAAAVGEFVGKLGLKEKLEVFGKRSEELAAERPNAYSAVIGRAVCSLPSLLELAAPLLENNGRLISMKAKESAEDMSAAAKAADILGFEMVSERVFSIEDTFERTVYVYQKVRQEQVKLPRRTGMAQKKPFGFK